MEILYEDNHIIAINKLSGELVQEDETGDLPLLEKARTYIKKKYNKPGNVFLEAVHRLDRPVSGVIIFARTSKALERLNKMFQKREMQKTYWAIVDGSPEKHEANLVHFIKKNRIKNKARAYENEVKESKKAELSYKVLKVISRHSLLEVKPKTGRPHQIRIQLSTIGHPIRGDVKYDYPHQNKNRSIHLHARELAFVHPVSKEKIRITAKVPHDQWWSLFF